MWNLNAKLIINAEKYAWPGKLTIEASMKLSAVVNDPCETETSHLFHTYTTGMHGKLNIEASVQLSADVNDPWELKHKTYYIRK